jgi:peptidylprolyl isomerase
MYFSKAVLSLSTLFVLGLTSFVHAEDAQIKKAPLSNEEMLLNLDLGKVSESFGHLVRKNIESLGLEFDVSRVIKGIEDSLAGKEPPMEENECIQAIALIQESSFQKQSKINLQLAEDFLAKNRQKDGVIELEEGKLQYIVETQGVGEAVKEEDTPTIRYSGEFADGSVFATSKDAEVISLQETIGGLAKAIVGMKEGEKRTVFIHPSLAFGESSYMPPNALIKFNIEVIKANTPQTEEESLTDQTLEEIALQQAAGAIR